MSNIILIGMPACGKSTVGVVLAKTTGKAFIDTDLLIQEREGDLLQNLIDNRGMEFFLDAEEKAILSIEATNSIIATGGSVVYSRKAMSYLSAIGKIVYIRLPLEIIEERLNNINSRGIAMGKNETLQDLYNKRVPLYEKYADTIVEAVDLTVEGIIEKIIKQTAK